VSGPPILDALRQAAESCEELGSPFTARLLRCLGEDLTPEGPLGPRLWAWAGARDEAVPLRLAGGLHALVLSGAAPALAAAYPPHSAEGLREALRDALRDHEAALDRWLDGPPQTNETARSAVLITAAHLLTARHPLALRLSELGASAGLNLRFDRYALEAGGARLGPPDAALVLRPAWTGAIPAPAAVTVAERRGVDLTPIDPSDPAQRLRLRAYVWADQAERMDRLDRALALPPVPVDRGDVAAWLPGRLAGAPEGQLHLVYHTVAWQYFPPATQEACRAALEAAGARATPEAPLAWLGMEGDGGPGGAVLTLRLWPGDLRLDLGRADFHGRWVDWRG
jgi:PTH1 family peptidyl-tRNA hydrolase